MLRERIQLHYEVHALEAERWMIHHACMDLEEARAIAQELWRRSQVAGVRVVKELYNATRDVAAARIVFQKLRGLPTKTQIVWATALDPERRRQLFAKRLPPPKPMAPPTAVAPARRPSGSSTPRRWLASSAQSGSGPAALASLLTSAVGAAVVVWFALSS